MQIWSPDYNDRTVQYSLGYLERETLAVEKQKPT